jgi:hypothetical protein
MRACLFRLLAHRPLEDWLTLALLIAVAASMLYSESFWTWSERVLPF